MKHLMLVLLAVAAQSAAPGTQSPQTFTGVVTDDMCALPGHAHMRMGPTDAACTIACVQTHDAAYVLYDGKTLYTLSDQRTPETFAGQRVRVTGTLDAKTKTIQVASMTATT